MKRLALVLFFLMALSLCILAQESNEIPALNSVEFITPFDKNGRVDRSNVRKNCFSFISETVTCGKSSDLLYSSLRAGVDWDWFQVTGIGSRNKIKKIGKKNWTDSINVPNVEPYAKLKEGKQRLIVLNGAGENGLDGKPGMNGDGTLNWNSNVLYKEMPQASLEEKEQPKSDYKPYVKAEKGNMYVVRVVDETNDFYVLFRVDELERGRRAKISWKKIEAPKKD